MNRRGFFSRLAGLFAGAAAAKALPARGCAIPVVHCDFARPGTRDEDITWGVICDGDVTPEKMAPPQLWNPITGEWEPLGSYREHGLVVGEPIDATARPDLLGFDPRDAGPPPAEARRYYVRATSADEFRIVTGRDA